MARKVWEPVKSGFVNENTDLHWDEAKSTLGVERIHDDTMQPVWLDVALPDNLRLCRAVDAPGVPSEVVETMRNALEGHRIAAVALFSDLPGFAELVAELDAALAWLDEQAGGE